jgi:enamine deaminase RidA (YjgF/YER057c/UK114 family)
MTHETLDEQFPVIIERLSANLADAGASWEKVERASFFLHNEEKLDDLRERFAKTVRVRVPDVEYTFVDTRQGKRLEIELTAKL